LDLKEIDERKKKIKVKVSLPEVYCSIQLKKKS